MTKRKSIGKKLRFEVFKRDNFTCQYCGGQAPDVVLHADHINPVAGGGDNDIMNLVTSCEPCNLGKGARELDDNSVLAKQRAQLEELNERREQLEMMMQWRQGLASIDEDPEENNRMAGKAFNMTLRVINARNKYADRPHMKDLFYTRAIIRNRMYCNERVAIDLLEQAHDLGAHIEELEDWAKTARNWTVWRNEMEDWIDTLSSEGGEE